MVPGRPSAHSWAECVSPNLTDNNTGVRKKAEPKDCRYRAERYGFHGKARNIKHKRSKIRAMMRKNLSD